LSRLIAGIVVIVCFSIKYLPSTSTKAEKGTSNNLFSGIKTTLSVGLLGNKSAIGLIRI